MRCAIMFAHLLEDRASLQTNLLHMCIMYVLFRNRPNTVCMYTLLKPPQQEKCLKCVAFLQTHNMKQIQGVGSAMKKQQGG